MWLKYTYTFVTTMLTAGVDRRDVQIAARLGAYVDRPPGRPPAPPGPATPIRPHPADCLRSHLRLFAQVCMIVAVVFPTQATPARDRRVRRSRSALMGAVVRLVTERGTADIPVSDIAAAADVSRRLVYQQFRDRDTLLLETTLDLARRELLPGVTNGPDPRAQTLTLATHVAQYRRFYRAVLTSACGFRVSRALGGLFLPLNRQAVQRMFGEHLPARTAEDLATFLTGGWGAFVDTWVVDGAEPLDPEAFTDRLLAAASALVSLGASCPHHPYPEQEGVVHDGP